MKQLLKFLGFWIVVLLLLLIIADTATAKGKYPARDCRISCSTYNELNQSGIGGGINVLLGPLLNAGGPVVNGFFILNSTYSNYHLEIDEYLEESKNDNNN